MNNKKIVSLLISLFVSLVFLGIIVFILSETGFLVDLKQKWLWLAALWLVPIGAFLAPTKTRSVLAHLFSSKKGKKFLLLTGTNIILTLLFVVVYAISQYGSPLIYENHPQGFKIAKEIPLIEGTTITQEFTADSNNLGTVGVRLSVQEKILGFDEEGEIVEIKPAEEIEEEITEEETQEEQSIGQDDLAEDEEDLEETTYYEPAEITFRIKEKGEEDWFYENAYYFDQTAPSHLYPFGFPVIEDSENKTYLVEIAGQKEIVLKKNNLFLFASVDKNNQPYLYSRFVYNKGELKENIEPILNNTLRKTNQVPKDNVNRVNLVTIFLLLEIAIYSFLNKNEKHFKEKIIPLFSCAFLFFLFLAIITSLSLNFAKVFPFGQIIGGLVKYHLSLSFSTIVLGSLTVLFPDTKTKKSDTLTKQLKKNSWTIGLIVGIFAFGLFLRIWQLDFLYPAGDEYRHLNAAKHFLEEGYFEYPRSPLITNILIFIRTTFNTNSLFLQRLPFALIGSLSIFLFYLIGATQNKVTGLIAAYLFASCPLAIGLSRYIREYEVILFIFLIFLYLSQKKILKNKFIQFLALLILFMAAQKIGLSEGYESVFFLFCLFTGFNYLMETLNKFTTKLRINSKVIIKVLAFIFVFVVGLKIIPLFTDYRVLASSETRYLFPLNFHHDSLLWYFSFVPYAFIVLLLITPCLKHPKKSYFWALFFTLMFSFYFYVNYFDAPRRFQVRYIYYVIPLFILLLSSGIHIFLDSFRQKKGLFPLSLALIILTFSPYNGINHLAKQENGEVNQLTELPHFDAGKLKKFLEQEKINPDKILTSYPYFFDYYYNEPFLKTKAEKEKYVHFPWSYEYYDRTRIFSINGYWSEDNIAQIKNLIRFNKIEFLVLHGSPNDIRQDRQYNFLLTKINKIEPHKIIDANKTFGFYVYRIVQE